MFSRKIAVAAIAALSLLAVASTDAMAASHKSVMAMCKAKAEKEKLPHDRMEAYVKTCVAKHTHKAKHKVAHKAHKKMVHKKIAHKKMAEKNMAEKKMMHEVKPAAPK
jgi:hypothetical protein